MQLLDDNVLGALKEKLFHPERLAETLSSLAERRAVRAAAVENRVVALQGEVSTAEQKLKRLYDSIAKGIVELDDLLGDQITLLKAEREKAKAALERAQSQGAGAVTIDAAKVDAFSRLMLDLLSNGETPALKAWLRSILGSIVVGDKAIRITGSKEVLAGAVTGRNSARQNVRGLVPEWRTREDSNLWPPPSEGGALSS